MKKPLILFVYGTRPEAVKLAPVIDAMKEGGRLRPVVCVTAQHREMLDQVNELFGIVPEYDLDIMRHGQSLVGILAAALVGLEPALKETVPHAVVVQGDTSTALSGALAAFQHQIPVVHVEAGLRTGRRYSPFPEEMNRRLIGQLADLHLAPTQENVSNLTREGVSRDSILVTGNTVIDALRSVVGRIGDPVQPALHSLVSDARRVLLVTTHRRESWGAPMERTLAAVRAMAERHEDMVVVFPMHRNPAVRDVATRMLGSSRNVILTEPLEYSDFVWCLQRSHLVLTDSGGVQEEAPSLGKPVLVLRDDTERPEAVAAGVALLVGTDTDRICDAVERLWTDQDAYDAMSRAINPYGDGQAAARSLAAIERLVE